MGFEDEYIIAITGHRDYPDRAALYRGIDRMKADHYYFGGARGVDSDALEYISRTQPNAVRTVVVPNRLADQPIQARIITKRYAHNVIELRNTGANRYMIRNQYMVDRSTKVQAFYDFRGSGGTHNTIEYARLKGKDFTVQPCVRYERAEYEKMSRSEFGSFVQKMKHFKVNLSTIKALIIHMVTKIFHMTMQAFIESIGYVGLRSLEAYWSL